MESNSPKVPFTVEQPAADLSMVGRPFAAKLTKETRATRTMMWLWTGEVSADGQGYRVLATGPEGSDARCRGHREEISRARDAPARVRNERQREGVRDRPAHSDSTVMPLILAVDTTSEYGSLALLRDGELLEEVAARAGGFGPVLYGELAALLERMA